MSASLENVPQLPHSIGGDNRAQAALARLGVSLAQLAHLPKISNILKEVKLGSVGRPSGRSMALEAMRFSETELIKKFLAKYDSIPERDRRSLPFEAVALAAKINVHHLWGEIMLAMREHSVNAVKVIAVAAHPEVMKKRVEFAQTEGGYRDRDALDTMLGALPSTKGTTFINKFFAGKSDDGEEKPPSDELVDDLDYVFPDASEMQERVQPMRQKLLEGRK